VNYRILYFFHDRTATVLSHGLTKEGRVPSTPQPDEDIINANGIGLADIITRRLFERIDFQATNRLSPCRSTVRAVYFSRI